MGKVIMSGIVPLLTVPANYPENFAEATWAQIIEACQKNKVPETWVVGSQKTMAINGADYAIDIIGKNHDTYSDGSGTAPLTFQLHDCYGATIMNGESSNKGGWTECYIRQEWLPNVLAVMSSEVKVGIRQVNKLTSTGYESNTITTTKDKLFLLSEIEIFGTTGYSVSGEGTQYDYYKAGNSKIKNMNNRAYPWWLRSPGKNSNSEFCYISKNGDSNTESASPGYAVGVSFAFCF